MRKDVSSDDDTMHTEALQESATFAHLKLIGSEVLVFSDSINLSFIQSIFDVMDDVVFFIKDTECRYVLVNHTFVRRTGRRKKEELIGKTSLEVFPKALGETYLAQDLQVLQSGVAIEKRLELHVYPNRKAGWCLTHKIPICDKSGKALGVAGISRDLGLPDESDSVYGQIASIAATIREHYHEEISLAELADSVGLTVARVERLFQRIFHYSPRQMLLKARIDAARSLLESSQTALIVDIAMACGYTDHSAFSRQFKASIGMTPNEYRHYFLHRQV